MTVEMLLAITNNRPVNKHNESHVVKARHGKRDNPAGLACTKNPDLLGVNVRSGSQRIHSSGCIRGQQIEVARIPRATNSL
jgi:hypothetical protein